ncbi:MAG: TonB-dependent receptor [Bacteroidaceae bacterium]|nr:TonB-dependent receptor [Bacteroidaceae bacterium]
MKRALSMFLFIFVGVSVALAQTTAKGTVIDATGEPIIGASVLEKGTTNGTITDFDGNFTLSVKNGATLVISYVGYVTQEVQASGNMNITLAEDSDVLDEVIVVGYGVQKKSAVTGAISSVKASDMEHRSITNAQSALQGKTAGVNVVQANKPGESPSIRVRGFSSNNDAAPLFVVDGVRLDNISGIEPNDIESMEILKDAASAAIYGAQAGNGVVLITTKKGKASENKWGTINFEYQFSSQSLAHTPALLNAQEYIQYESERLGLSTEEYKSNAMANGWDGKTDTDWYKGAFENSAMHKYTISMQNATDKGSYYISLGHVADNGIVTGNRDTYRRLTGNVTADHKITSWLTVGTNNQIEKYTQRSVATGVTGYAGNVITSTMHMDPLTKVSYAESELTPDMRRALAQGHTLLKDPSGRYYGVSSFSDDMYNPLILINNGNSENYGWNVTGSAYANITPFKGFTFTSRFGYRLNASHSKSMSKKWYGFATASNTKIDLNGQTNMGTYYQWENFANYMKTIAEKHDITAMAGMSFTKNINDYTSGSLADSKGDAVLIDDWYGFSDLNNGLSSVDNKGVGGAQSVSTSLSYYGRVGYTYDSKYMIQASLRADAYDLARLPRNNRWGYFPAVSVGWTVTRENFMEGTQSWLDDLKIRGSWGQNGSISALYNYMYSADMRSGFNVAMWNPTTGMTDMITSSFPKTMGNLELTWETSEQLDLGFDARLFQNRLTIAADWYKKSTKDLLIPEGQAILSMEQGGTSAALNAGNVTNSGIELELGWQDNIGDFKYSVRGNIATLKNKVTYLHPSITRLNGTSCYNKVRTVFEKNHSVWHYYGYEFDYIDGEGNPQFKDLNGDGIVDDSDKTDIGDAVPDFTYGITLSASYKGFDFTLFGTGSYGNQIFNNYGRGDGQNSYNKTRELFYTGRWTPGMAAHQAMLPRASADLDWYLNSSAMVFNASFFKIKQIQLGYTLPKKVLKKAFMNTCRIYASLEDFFTFTPYLGFDPEATGGTGSAMGIDNGSYPASKKVLLGINVSF